MRWIHEDALIQTIWTILQLRNLSIKYRQQHYTTERMWREELGLFMSDRLLLTTGGQLNRQQHYTVERRWREELGLFVSDRLLLLLRKQYVTNGLQKWELQVGNFVQILNAENKHWTLVSNINCQPGEVNIYRIEGNIGGHYIWQKRRKVILAKF